MNPVNIAEPYRFEVHTDGLYLISITARCKSWLQNLVTRFGDDDLAIAIDSVPFHEYAGKRKEFATPASWNGNELKGKSKTNWFIVPLARGEHSIGFSTDGRPVVEKINIASLVTTENEIHFALPSLPQDIALKNIGLVSVTSSPTGTQVVRAQQGTVEYIRVRATRWNSPSELTMKISGYSIGKCGTVRLYSDLGLPRAVHLYSLPSTLVPSQQVSELKDRETIEIVEEVVRGEWITDKSYIWHKLKVRNMIGYALSTFIEIEGQERGLVIEKIRQYARKWKMDEALMTALAGCESRYKRYAASHADNKLAAKGIFQLTDGGGRAQLEQIGFPLPDPFDLERNIEGGILYAKWLRDNYYAKVDDRVRKLVAAYNWGHTNVPPRAALHLEKLPDQTAALIRCIAGKTQRHSSFTFSVIAILLLGFSLFVSRSSVNQEQGGQVAVVPLAISPPSSFHKSVTEFSPHQLEDRAVLYDGRRGLVFLVNQERKLRTVIPFDILDLDNILPTEDAGRPWDIVSFDQQFYEHPVNVFYFIVTRSGYCGSAGCTWLLYKLDTSHPSTTLDYLGKWWGGIEKFVPSPDGRWIALTSTSGNDCIGGSVVSILETETTKRSDVEFNDEFDRSWIKSVHWVNATTIEFEMVGVFCPWSGKGPGLWRRSRYNAQEGIRTLLEEHIYEPRG